jgi:hypothetical protein
MKLKKLKSIAFPEKMGCKLAGGNWKIYLELLENFSQKVANDGVSVFLVSQ